MTRRPPLLTVLTCLLGIWWLAIGTQAMAPSGGMHPYGLAAPPPKPAMTQASVLAPTTACGLGSPCVYLPLINTPSQSQPNPGSRVSAVNLFNTAYLGSQGVPTGWNGNVSGCDPGVTTQAFRDSVLLRLNYFRKMAGIPPVTDFNGAYNTQDQAAALMMAANHSLNHTPPSSWTCYTTTGYAGSSSSNLALGAYGPAAIDLYMDDGGVSSLGHRRWILYPQTQEMGTGDISGSNWQEQSNALKAWDDHIWDPRPSTLYDFVAWPPPTHIPYQVVYPAWSFAVANADFSGASVAVSLNGASLPVTVSRLPNGYGENTLAFSFYGGYAWPRPSSDTAYQIAISNVVVNGAARSYTYTVTVIDPAG